MSTAVQPNRNESASDAAPPALKRHKPTPCQEHAGPRLAAYGAPLVFQNPAVVERLYDAVNDLRVKGKRTKKRKGRKRG